MDDAELARAAAVYFGGRVQAEHTLTCDDCNDDVRCKRYPKSRRNDVPRAQPSAASSGVRRRSQLEPAFRAPDGQHHD